MWAPQYLRGGVSPFKLSLGFGGRQTWLRIPAQPLLSCVTLVKSIHSLNSCEIGIIPIPSRGCKNYEEYVMLHIKG